LEAITQRFAGQWIRTKQRGINLQDLYLWGATEVFRERNDEMVDMGGVALALPSMLLPKDVDLP
jgi:hypothetical protein